MRIAKINTDDITALEQLEKVNEEENEFWDEVEKWGIEGNNTAELLSEMFDDFTSKYNLVRKLGISHEQIQSHLKLHYQKLENRHEEGRINIESWEEC